MNKFSIVSAILGFALLIACTQFEDVGSDLVRGGEFDVHTITDLPILFENVQRDSFLGIHIDDLRYVPTQHFIAKFDDPIFGETEYAMNCQMQLLSSNYNFEGATFDSAFFYLAYDTNTTPYGLYDQMQTIDVYEIDGDMPNNIFTQDTFPYKDDLLGSLTFLPAHNTPIVVDTSTTLDPHIKIPLNSTFGERILALDSATASDVIAFTDEFNGLALVPRSDNFSCGLKFNLSNSITGVSIHYTQDTVSRVATLSFRTNLPHYNAISHNLENSPAQAILDENALEPEYLFIQPGNLGIKLTLEDLAPLQNKIINKAELTLEIAGHPLDDTVAYYPPFDIFMLKDDDYSSRAYISDIINHIDDSQYRLYFIGLSQENSEGNGAKLSYYLNITNQLQHIVDGKDKNELFIVTTPQDANRISRSVLYGPGASDPLLRPKLKVTYSSLK